MTNIEKLGAEVKKLELKVERLEGQIKEIQEKLITHSHPHYIPISERRM